MASLYTVQSLRRHAAPSLSMLELRPRVFMLLGSKGGAVGGGGQLEDIPATAVIEGIMSPEELGHMLDGMCGGAAGFIFHAPLPSVPTT